MELYDNFWMIHLKKQCIVLGQYAFHDPSKMKGSYENLLNSGELETFFLGWESLLIKYEQEPKKHFGYLFPG